MRLLLAMFKHETNTFSPVPTKFERFFPGYPNALSGTKAINELRDTGCSLAGFIKVAEQHGAEIEVAVAATAWPSGPVDNEAYERISALILEQVKQGGFDGILLDLHGAMVSHSCEDGEGRLLQRLREIDSTTPVGVTLDMHANMYDELIKNATVVNGYHTYPHIDMFEAGVRTADIIIRTIKGEIKPVMAWGMKPMLPHVLMQGTHMEPNKSLQEQCIAMEQSKVLASSLFVGFPQADIANAGLSVVICTNDDAQLARQKCDTLLDDAWKVREQFLYHSEPLIDSIVRAKLCIEYPVVLLDHCDNCASGGTLDSTVVLAEIIRQDLNNVVFYAIKDPLAARQAAHSGVGTKLTLLLGGKTPMPALRDSSHPISVEATVKTISDGIFYNRGPMLQGMMNNTGLTVVVDTGRVVIVIISEDIEPHDINCLLSLGIDPLKKSYIALKSRVHWRAGFGEMARHVIECAGLGVTTSDYSQLVYRHVRRPIYPLDAM
ncbi:M81 family metallopeptidase [Solimicrobium silvestre]|uniref:Microcystinase C n=1 Tax=Solimicrobium silvestre TaxID=2099400 RepID=A0A2S9H162_9BURK|nr:M81 family metallopeptidase [Solimicrobium silvestre]PRC93719.1 hypothetical protein S2091_1720 [Solimicrobium silvestre]